MVARAVASGALWLWWLISVTGVYTSFDHPTCTRIPSTHSRTAKRRNSPGKKRRATASALPSPLYACVHERKDVLEIGDTRVCQEREKERLTSFGRHRVAAGPITPPPHPHPQRAQHR